MITIYKKNTELVRAHIEPEDNSEQSCTLMGENVVNLTFALPVYCDFQRGDYCYLFGEIYKLNILPVVTKEHNRKYVYSATFEASQSDLGKVQYLFLDENNDFTEGTFPLHGTALDFMNLLLMNVKRVYPNAGWKLGSVIDSGYKLLEFSGENCLSVLNRLAEEFDTEFLVEGKKINLYRKQSNSGLIFSYGPNEALLSVTRSNTDNSNKVTRLYVYGGNKNIGSDYRNGAQRLRLEERFIEKRNSDDEIIEETVVFDDIYPFREGVVSSVTSPFVFADNLIDFDINDYQLPAPSVPKLTFNTGKLSGYTFDLLNFNNTTKTFTIQKNTSEQTLDIPSEVMKPEVGDKYVVTDILQPLKYIVNAEDQLRMKGIEKIDELYADKLSFSVICNPLWFKDTAKTINLGQIVNLSIPEMGINTQIRTVGFTRNIRRPNVYSLKLADVAKTNTLLKLINGI